MNGGTQTNNVFRLSDTFLLTVGANILKIYNLKKKVFIEEATVSGGVITSCFMNKTRTLVVGLGDGAVYINADDIERPHRRLYEGSAGKVTCDPSGENILVGFDKEIRHYYINPIVQDNAVLTLTESFAQIAFFEKASAANIVTGAIKVTSSQWAFILYEFGLECDPSCTTCTHRCACNDASKNKLVFSRGICVNSCSYTDEQSYLLTDKNNLNYCIGSCGQGFFSTENYCGACPTNCAGCVAADACFSCLPDKLLYGTITGQPALFRSCVSLKKGYFRIGSTNKAGKCQESCRTCSSDGACDTCYNKKYI